jgi:PAS domain S-box-containing protein
LSVNTSISSKIIKRNLKLLASSFKIITKPEWIYKSMFGGYEYCLSIIKKDVILSTSTGYARKADVQKAEIIIQKAIDEFFPSDTPIYFISDFATTTGSSTGARNEHVHNRLKQLDRTLLFIYSGPNTLLKIVIKAGSLLSSQVRKKVYISKDIDHALSIIEQHRKKTLPGSEKLTGSKDSIDSEKKTLSLPDNKEELKDLVIKLQKEKLEQKHIIREKSNQLIKAMGKVTWKMSSGTELIKILEKDDFADLFSAFNLLQMDLAELIRNQKKSQEELIKKEKQYKILFKNIADIVLLHDIKTQYFVDCNERALKYGYTKKELLTMTPLDLHPPEELGRIRNNINGDNKIPDTDNRYHHIMKDGTQVDVEIRTSKIEYNGRPTWVSIVRDITSRKQFEAAIIKKQKEAEAASMAKSDFLANMSHEIRTPMNGVIGMLDLLLETDLSENQYEFAAVAQQSADSLLLLINDILDFSKIEARKLEVETIDFDLSVTLDSLSDLLSIKAFEKGIEFACLLGNEVPLLLKGDPSRLRQILSNLAGNAIKFTPQGKILIKVSLNKKTEKNATLLFEVIDTGVGIPIDKLNTLFESFTQVDASTTRKYGGTGLGLAISRQLTELMGGKIRVKSEIGKGSNFYFTIVFEKQAKVRQKIILAEEIKGTKILVVDKSHTNHQIFKEYLKSWGCPSDIANNGDDALLLLKQAAKTKNPYKLALIDMEMPNMSGQSLGEIIKNHKDIKGTILILLSSSANRGDAKKFKGIGFAGFLTKPIKKNKLFDTLRAVLSIDSQNLNQPSDHIITSYKVEEIKKTLIKNGQGLNILIVEDNRVNQLVTKKMLQQMAREITIANNGKEAVNLFLKKNFDLIFMDIQMPVMDGKQATKKIRELEKQTNSHTPIIALTANAMKGDREQFIACGTDEYLSKPLKKENLIKVMKSLDLI